MKCSTCGSTLESVVTDLPFKISDRCIVIIKHLPVIECRNCTEYLIENPVMERVDEILSKVDESAELEILPYAA